MYFQNCLKTTLFVNWVLNESNLLILFGYLLGVGCTFKFKIIVLMSEWNETSENICENIKEKNNAEKEVCNWMND